MTAAKNFIRSLTATQQAILAAATLVTIGGSVTGLLVRSSLGAQVERVAADQMAFDAVTVAKDAAQDREIRKLDEDLDLMSQTQMRTTTKLEDLEKKVDWSNDALWKMARGREERIHPPPLPSPTPTPESP